MNHQSSNYIPALRYPTRKDLLKMMQNRATKESESKSRPGAAEVTFCFDHLEKR